MLTCWMAGDLTCVCPVSLSVIGIDGTKIYLCLLCKQQPFLTYTELLSNHNSKCLASYFHSYLASTLPFLSDTTDSDFSLDKHKFYGYFHLKNTTDMFLIHVTIWLS